MTKKQNKPVHTVKVRSVRAAVWENTGDNGKWFNVTVVRLYKQDDKFHESSSFAAEDLPLVGIVAARAFDWVMRQQ